MILEKIRQHAGKISFFVISLLLVVIGAMYLNQKNQAANSNQKNPDYTGNANTSASASSATTKAPTATKTPSSTTKVS